MNKPNRSSDSIVQELLAQVGQLKAELASLKTHVASLPVSPEPSSQPSLKPRPTIDISRRNSLKRLGMALFGGAATIATLSFAPTTEAKISVNPTVSGGKIGSLVTIQGAPVPINSLPTGSSGSSTPVGYYYGLVASANSTVALNLSNLPSTTKYYGVVGYGVGTGTNANATGVAGIGSVGVYGYGGVGVNAVVSSNGGTGVYSANNFADGYGIDTYGPTAVHATGTNYGVLASGATGVYASGTNYGVEASGRVAIRGIGSNGGVIGSGPAYGVAGFSTNGNGVFAQSDSGPALHIDPSSAPTSGGYMIGDIYVDNSGYMYIYGVVASNPTTFGFRKVAFS